MSAPYLAAEQFLDRGRPGCEPVDMNEPEPGAARPQALNEEDVFCRYCGARADITGR